MRSIRWWCLAALAAACSSSSNSSGDIGRPGSSGNVGAPVGGAAATTGSGTGTGGGTASGFGNSTAPVGSAPRMQGAGGATPSADAGACTTGQFCAANGPDQGCGTITEKPTQKMIKMPGNVMLVWDRSTSMMQDWNGMVRWQAAGTALIAALTPLANDLKIAGIFFPSVVSSGMQREALAGSFSCDVDAYSAPGQLPFMPGPDFLAALQKADPSNTVNPIYAAGSAQATPTYAALAEADRAIQAATLQGTLAVVLITDGEPTCTDWDQNQATMLVANWLKLYGAKTYVIGLPSMDINANGQAVLNAVAQAGGTDKYIDPTNSANLQMQINQIVSLTISSSFDSCAFDLNPPTSAADKLQLVVEEASMPGVEEQVPRDLGAAGGWTITADGSHIEIVGALCDSAKAGKFSSVQFKYGCKDIPPLPPSHVQ